MNNARSYTSVWWQNWIKTGSQLLGARSLWGARISRTRQVIRAKAVSRIKFRLIVWKAVYSLIRTWATIMSLRSQMAALHQVSTLRPNQNRTYSRTRKKVANLRKVCFPKKAILRRKKPWSDGRKCWKSWSELAFRYCQYLFQQLFNQIKL